MTQNRAALLVQLSIVVFFVSVLLAFLVSPLFWAATLLSIFGAMQFGHFHNTGRFYGLSRDQ